MTHQDYVVEGAGDALVLLHGGLSNRDDFDAQIRDLEERIRRQRSANGRLSGPTRDQGHRPGKDDEAANRRKKDPTAASYPGATRSFTSSVMPCSAVSTSSNSTCRAFAETLERI